MTRLDHQHIIEWITPGARVIDLGCEDGALLAALRRQKNARGIGVDMNNEQLTRCMARGISAIHTDIRDNLSLFPSGAYDYVILSQTLQNIDRPPQQLLSEMLRIGKTAILSFPNFAYYPMRLQLLAGRMPSGGQLQYDWHDTPHVRYCTIGDFERWCNAKGFKIDGRVFLNRGGAVRRLANLRAETAIYRITRAAGVGDDDVGV